MTRYDEWHCHPLRAIAMWAIASCFIMVQFFLQLSLGVIAKPLRIDLQIDAIGLGILAASYYVIYMFLQTPSGFMIPYLGLRRIFTFGGLLCALGCLLFATGLHLSLALAGRIFMGGGLAFVFIGYVSLCSTWFPMRYFALLVGIAETVAMAGAFSGNMILESVTRSMHWTNFYFLISALIVVLSGLAWITVKEDPDIPSTHISLKTRWQFFLENLKILLPLPSVYIVGVYAGLCYTVPTVFAALWGIPFLAKAHQMTHFEATTACSMIFLGLAVGAPILSWIFSEHPYRKHFMIGNPALMFVILLLVILIPNLPHTLIYILTATLGFQCGGLIICYTVTSELSSLKTHSACLGMMNTLALGLTPVCQAGMGWFLDLQTDVVSANNIEVYTAANYRTTLIILPGLALISALLGFFFPETPMQLYEESEGETA